MEDSDMARSNVFAVIENVFEFGTKKEITQITVEAFEMLDRSLHDKYDEQSRFMILVKAARLGVASEDGTLNRNEKKLAKAAFSSCYSGDLDDLYQLIGGKIEDADYDLVKDLCGMGNEVAIQYLLAILGFAYIDEEGNEEVLDRLDPIYGLNLLAFAQQCGWKEIPRPRYKAKGLEKDIVKWLRSNDTLRTIKEFKEQFPGRSEDEIREAIERLCKERILYGAKFIVGEMYGLAGPQK